MRFGLVPLSEAEGTILAHAVKAKGRRLAKGRVLSAEDVAALAAAGIPSVTAARLEAGDLGEDEAARRLAAAARGANVTAAEPFTGRANLFAEVRGIAVIDRAAIDRVNMVDESMTLATVVPFEVVEARQMVATIKVIPFAVAEGVVARCVALAAEADGLVHVAPFQPRRAGLVQTALPGTKESVLDRTAEVIRARLARLGSRLETELRCDHECETLARALDQLAARGLDPLLVVGASAISDRRDIVPAAIEAAGGRVIHLGMPVDPGNLLLLGRDGRGTPVVGLPGCARSPSLNGVDWVLERLLAGVALDGRGIMAMGAGGLLKETPIRSQPRVPEPLPAKPGPAVAALVLAAGRSLRMGETNKLLAEVGGRPMVVHAVDAALASKARPVVVVVGHEAARVRAVLGERSVRVVENPHFSSGLSTSLRCGLAALPVEAEGAVVLLGDMPRVNAAHVDRLIAAFNPVEGRAICVPAYRGKRGNPVLWARRFFAEMMEVAGDVGARHLIGAHAEAVCEVAMETDDVLVDVDTPEALRAATDDSAEGSHQRGA